MHPLVYNRVTFVANTSLRVSLLFWHFRTALSIKYTKSRRAVVVFREIARSAVPLQVKEAGWGESLFSITSLVRSRTSFVSAFANTLARASEKEKKQVSRTRKPVETGSSFEVLSVSRNEKIYREPLSSRRNLFQLASREVLIHLSGL